VSNESDPDILQLLDESDVEWVNFWKKTRHCQMALKSQNFKHKLIFAKDFCQSIAIMHA